MNMNSGGLENLMRQMGGNSNSGAGFDGASLAAMFGDKLPKGVDPKQMEGMWKFLDNMAESDPAEYKKFIDEQMKEMKTEIGKEKEEEVKNQTIQSEPAFCTRILIVKKVETKDRKSKQQKSADGIKLFDTNKSEIKESFLDKRGDPLEEPKLYLNVVYNDNVLPPLNKQRDLADPKNDRDWLIIPMVFTEPKQRKSMDNLLCIHYDCHVNTCVVMKMREEQRTMTAICNYLVTKFQEHIEDEYILHTKSIKFLKNRKYKCAKGSESQKVVPFVLPKEHDVRSFKKVKESLKKEQEEQKKATPSKQDIKLPTAEISKSNPISNDDGFKIPGVAQPEIKRKPVVIEVIGKTIPNFDLVDNGSTVTMTLNVEEESSAKDIDLDISETQLKLTSQFYELKYDFKLKVGYNIEPQKVGAKFSKLKKTLALTFTKKE